jgi:hypothetical protein
MQPKDEKLLNDFSLTQNNFVYNLRDATRRYLRKKERPGKSLASNYNEGVYSTFLPFLTK